MPLSYVYGKDPDRISVSQLKLTVMRPTGSPG